MAGQRLRNWRCRQVSAHVHRAGKLQVMQCSAHGGKSVTDKVLHMGFLVQ